MYGMHKYMTMLLRRYITKGSKGLLHLNQVKTPRVYSISYNYIRHRELHIHYFIVTMFPFQVYHRTDGISNPFINGSR